MANINKYFNILPKYLCCSNFYYRIKTTVLELLIMCNGLGIFSHSIINHLHNFAITVNMYILTQNSANSELSLPPFGRHNLIEQSSRSLLISHSLVSCMNIHWVCLESGPWKLSSHVNGITDILAGHSLDVS